MINNDDVEIGFTIPGRPQGKPTSRVFVSKTGKPIQYAGAKQGEYKARIQEAWNRVQPADWQPHEGPVFLSIQAYFLIPKSWSKRRKATELFYVGKPDADNMVKAIGDALTGLAWRDDKQVMIVAAFKYLTNRCERVEVLLGFGANTLKQK